MLTKYKQQLSQLWQPCWIIVLWCYTLVISYTILGAWVYPFWWKRFLFDGGLWQASYWKFALEFLSAWLQAYHPLIVTLVVLVIGVVIRVVYRFGRDGAGITKVLSSGPPRKLVLGLTAVATITAISLLAMKGAYETHDEISTRLRAESDAAWKAAQRTIDGLLGFEPPKSGLYVYLDSEKLDQAFSSLQQDLTTVLARTTQGQSESTTGAVGLSGIDVSRVAAHQIQKSIDQVPTQTTPARRAQWLIAQYAELRIVEKLYSSSSSQEESYKLQELRKELSARGVTLSRAQEKALREGDAKVRLAEVSKVGSPVFYKGKMTIEPVSAGLKVSFDAHNGLKVHGNLKNSATDFGVQSCVRDRKRLCSFDASIMGQILRASPEGLLISLEVIPIAIW